MTGLDSVLRPDQVGQGEAILRSYQSDSYTVEHFLPDAVVFPESTEEVARVVKWCNQTGTPFTARGAGTGLSGGAMPATGGVIVSLKRMKRILDYSLDDLWMKAEAGTVNVKLTEEVKPFGLHFAPDPSSQSVSTLGGNIAENSGGPHTLKYGVTAQHILGLTMVSAAGEVLEFGGPLGSPPGFDFLSLIVGSEGTVGIVTEAYIRLTPSPKAVETATFCFTTTDDACRVVAQIVAEGVLPAAVEMMDRNILVAVREAFGITFPEETQAMLLVETDGDPDLALTQIKQAMAIAESCGAIEIRKAETAAERDKLWTARKKGIGALGRLAPSKVTHDGVIPPSKLPEMLAAVYAIAARHGVGIANLFHAGDGNLHPVMYFDEREPGIVDKVIAAGEEIIEKCLELGGSVSGEHGIGVEKTSLLVRMFDENSMAMQVDARNVFHRNPLCNPCKIVPDSKSCVEHKMRWRGVAT